MLISNAEPDTIHEPRWKRIESPRSLRRRMRHAYELESTKVLKNICCSLVKGGSDSDTPERGRSSTKKIAQYPSILSPHSTWSLLASPLGTFSHKNSSFLHHCGTRYDWQAQYPQTSTVFHLNYQKRKSAGSYPKALRPSLAWSDVRRRVVRPLMPCRPPTSTPFEPNYPIRQLTGVRAAGNRHRVHAVMETYETLPKL